MDGGRRLLVCEIFFRFVVRGEGGIKIVSLLNEGLLLGLFYFGAHVLLCVLRRLFDRREVCNGSFAFMRIMVPLFSLVPAFLYQFDLSAISFS